MDKSWFGIPSIIIYLLLKVFFQTPLLINQPMGIWDIYGDPPLDPPLGFLVIYVVILNAWLSIPTRERCCFSSALKVNLPLCLIIPSNGWYCIWYHVLYMWYPLFWWLNLWRTKQNNPGIVSSDVVFYVVSSSSSDLCNVVHLGAFPRQFGSPHPIARGLQDQKSMLMNWNINGIELASIHDTFWLSVTIDEIW